jgi:hypothetical protein
MVAGRTHEREAAPLDGCDGAARRQQPGLVARRRGDGVRVEQGRDLDRLDDVDVGRLVAALYLFTRGGRALDDLEGLQQRLEPRPCLDVGLRRMELGQLRMAYEVDRTASASASSG